MFRHFRHLDSRYLSSSVHCIERDVSHYRKCFGRDEKPQPAKSIWGCFDCMYYKSLATDSITLRDYTRVSENRDMNLKAHHSYADFRD